jgi:hypothetical protein
MRHENVTKLTAIKIKIYTNCLDQGKYMYEYGKFMIIKMK